MAKLVSGRVKKTPQLGITSDRYEFLGLEQTEPDLGDPLVGPSSEGANPYSGAIGDSYVLISDGSKSGKRYWTKQPNIIATGVIQPGSITVRDEGVIIGAVNQVTDINFVGTGVTVISPASWVGAGSSSVDIQIAVTDIFLSSGQTGSIPYKDSNQFLQGAPDFIYDFVAGNVGIGSTIPRVKLDVLGDAIISGILTVGVLSAPSGTFTNLLNVSGGVNVSGAATFTSINVQDGIFDQLTANKITTGFITATNGFIGVQTSNIINSSNFISTNLTVNNGIVTNLTGVAATISNFSANTIQVSNILLVDTNTLFVNSSNKSVGIGTTIPTQKVQVGTSTNPVVITDNARIGIGTTNPSYNLDVRGTVGFNSFIFVGGTSGNANEVLLSGGSNLPSWGSPLGVTVGAANSVGVANTQLNSLFYPTFTRQIIDNGEIRIDTTGLSFNPALNYFGIGTTNLNYNLTVNGSVGVNTNTFFVSGTNNRIGVGTTIPTSTLDVIGDIKSTTSVSAGTTVIIGTPAVSHLSSGIITTTTTTDVVIGSISTSLFRSAKYNVQITCTGQLVGSATSSSSLSVSNLQGGTDYVSGNYPNVSLVTSVGSGAEARANFVIEPEQTLSVNSISNAIFNVDNITGVKNNAPIVFDRLIPATPAENSKVTSITLLNNGSGYTAFPTLQFAAPTNNPPIPNVTGTGITATAEVRSMFVSNVAITTAGIHTFVPSISFKAPVGSGTSATGIVGYGISTILMSAAGRGYNPLPAISVISTPSPIQSASISISTVFVTDVYSENTGFGYTSANFPTIRFSLPNVGVNSATAIVNSLGISTHFIVVPGIGYTRPPILTASPPNVGLNTARVSSTLGISSITVVSSGVGYTNSSQIQLGTIPNVIGFSASVGMGVTTTNILISGGSGYSGGPTVTFSPPQIGVNTATGQFQAIETGGVLSNFVITNRGSGYLSPPQVDISGGGGVGAAVTITSMVITDVTINNTGFGVTVVPSVSVFSPVGTGASVTASMGIGKVDVIGFGSGYNNAPSIGVTAFDGLTGSGASVIAGLGVTSTNITLTNAGAGYSAIPSITITSPSTVSIGASAIAGVGINAIRVNSPGIGYSGALPTINISTAVGNRVINNASAFTSTIVVTNVFISNGGIGYTATDLSSLPIATFSPVGTGATVGFGVSTVTLTNLGIGYTTAASAAITFSAPNLSIGTTVTASASLGSPGILPGPGVNTTGETQIYYVANVTAPGSIGISTGVGIGTLTTTDVGNDLFTENNPVMFIGGRVTNVSVVSPGSGYTNSSILSASNFDGANVGTGFSFTVARTVNNYQVSDVIILQSVGSASTTCDFLEYGTIANNEILGSFNADISGSNARLLFSPTYRNNTIKVSSHSITN